jgi:hypothetical protein
MRDDRSGNSPWALRKHVSHRFGPGDTVFYRIGERNRGIQVRARNRPKRQNESEQRCTCRNRVRQQSNGDIPACQPFAHDSRADHSGHQERAAEKLSRQSARKLNLIGGRSCRSLA